MGNSPLKEEFSGLFALVMDKKLTMVDSFDFGRSVWNPRLRRDVYDWELEKIVRFLSVLDNLKPDRN